MKKPAALRPHDVVGVIATAETFSREKFAEGIAVIQRWGFRVRYDRKIFRRHRHFAGTDRMRALHVNRMFADPQVKAIMCAAGGYGTARVLPLLDHACIRANPKIFVGYSDMTLMLAYCRAHHELVTLHGPVVAGELHKGMSRQTADSLYTMLTGVNVPFLLLRNVEVLRPGTAAGVLVGGNLSRLCETLGTSYEIQTKDAILFVEDIDIAADDFDSFASHLAAAGKFRGLRGIIVGTLRDQHRRYLSSETVMSTLREIVRPLRIPVVGTRKCGHGRINLTMPLGVQVRIDSAQKAVWLLESPVRR